jgi:hypothetical protein
MKLNKVVMKQNIIKHQDHQSLWKAIREPSDCYANELKCNEIRKYKIARPPTP